MPAVYTKYMGLASAFELFEVKLRLRKSGFGFPKTGSGGCGDLSGDLLLEIRSFSCYIWDCGAGRMIAGPSGREESPGFTGQDAG